MAINFPATAGQATDGTFTYTVAGITYAWNGSSWAAAGAGATATDRTLFSVATNSPSGGGSLVYSSASGAFTYTPPSLSGFLTAETDTLATVTGRGNTTTQTIETTLGSFKANIGNSNQGFYLSNSGSTHLAINWSASASRNQFRGNGSHPLWFEDFSYIQISPSSTYVQLDYAGSQKLQTSSTGVTVTGALTAGGLTYPTTNGTSGQVLTGDGAGNVTWGTPAGQRTTAQVTVNIANEAVSNTSFTTPKGYALIKVSTSHAAWVTLYSDTGSRTADASRQINVDPLPGSGVLSEVITTGNQVQLITPGTICFNSAGTGITYTKIVNKSGSTANITVTLTYIVLEG